MNWPPGEETEPPSTLKLTCPLPSPSSLISGQDPLEFCVYYCLLDFTVSPQPRISFFFPLLSFIYLWPCWVFAAALRLSLLAASAGSSSSRGSGFLLCWLLLLWSTGSRRSGFSSCSSGALERWLNTCDAWIQLPCGMWDFPGAGI